MKVDKRSLTMTVMVKRDTGDTSRLEVHVEVDVFLQTVTVNVHAETESLCERFAAEAVWVILDDVPDGYRVAFLLESSGP